LTYEWNGLEQSSLADQDVEEYLVDANELAEGAGNGSGIRLGSDRLATLHLGDGRGSSRDDVSETSNDCLRSTPFDQYTCFPHSMNLSRDSLGRAPGR
jgi:hypothetical protein